MDEETARAEIYGLLAQLYLEPPAAELLAQLRVAVTEAPASGALLEEPWRAVVGSARGLGDDAIRAEYDALFGGVGKPEIYLYGSHYMAGFLNEKPLARLRGDLAALGLAGNDSRGDTDDHVSYVFEVMRYLIAGEDVAIANLTRQSEFFAAHVQPWVSSLCEAIAAHPRSNFYAAVAGFTREFMGVEAQAFDMLA
jgi:TorA maturation chaperone TorD